MTMYIWRKQLAKKEKKKKKNKKNKNKIKIKLRSFKSSEHFNEKGDGPYIHSQTYIDADSGMLEMNSTGNYEL